MFEVRITYQTNRNGADPHAYSLSITPTEKGAQSLAHVPPVFNNISVTRGVFPTTREAVQAALGYIAAPCKIVSLTDLLSHVTTYQVQRVNEKNRHVTAYVELLGSNHTTGTFVAA